MRVRLGIKLTCGIVLFVGVACSGGADANVMPQPAPTDETEAMDRIIAEMLAATDGNVPGIAVAVVQGADLVYLRGFGKADVEKNLPVRGDTPFYIASSTKSYTSLALALLAEEGAIDLDGTLSRYASGVNFAPAVRANEVTIRHLLSHTSGLQNPALTFRTAFTGDHSPRVRWDLLAATEARDRTDLGEFDYTNLGYNIVSQFVDDVTGKPWQDVLAESVFEPAGLTHTTAYASEARSFGKPVAEPYTAFGANGSAERAYLVKQDNTMHAAGGMYTTAIDAARWIEAQMNDGVIDGRQVFPADVIRQTHVQAASVDAAYGDFQRDGYGLGWYRGGFGGDLSGERHIHHFGGFGGAHSHISFLPERQIGVAVFVNESGIGGNLAMSIATLAYRLWLGREGATEEAERFIEEIKTRLPQFRARVEADRQNREGREWQLSLPVNNYTGTYVHELFGTAIVTNDHNAPRLQIGNMVAGGTPLPEADAMRVELIPMRGEVVQFHVDDDVVSELTYDGVTYTRI